MSSLPELNDVLNRLGDLQRNTSPINLTIGYTSEDRQVQHNVIVLHDAPGNVVTAVVQEFPFVSLCDNGLHIPAYREES
jgi:hypothetical protein